MSDSTVTDESKERLERLQDYLAADPNNDALLGDAAETALSANLPDVALGFLDRIAAQRELNDRELHLVGLSAMAAQDNERAATIFQTLADRGIEDPGIAFNLAWSKTMLGAKAEALDLLSDDVAEAVPQAAMLKIQLLHDAGDLEEAERVARDAIERHPTHRGLAAAVSVLALDIDDPELAARCAAAAGDHPDALTTLGTLALGNDQTHDALQLFEMALGSGSSAPRAWIGRGLARLGKGEAEEAAHDIDHGASIFETHLGSWIAAGWAHFVNKDTATARARFEKARDIDPNFAEVHGSLAVLDLLDGREDDARRQVAVALRLDPQCFSAALAQVLISSARGNEEAARRIFDKAVNTPVDDSGRTIAQALSRMGLSRS